jgi:hypothetical protein
VAYGAANKDPLPPELEAALLEMVASTYADPYAFVMTIFPWGEEGTALEDQTGPDDWQREQLQRIGEEFERDPETTIREAIASGHGIGKSAEVAWIILWAMSTRAHLNGVVTANTTAQLSTKTWRELAVWHKLALNAHWFKWTATKFFHVEHPETWFTAAIPNTEQNSEAFAGLHAKHVLVIYDEASAIPDKIWEVSEGAMTTPRAMWFAFGNPTRNTGRFRDCFGKDRHRWVTQKIDSRTCKMTNKKVLEEWVETYGEDSDFVRVRVRGEFPRAGSMQFINSDLVDGAMTRKLELETYMHMPILLGVDVARFGDDKSVISVRQGRRELERRSYRELDTMEYVREISLAIREFRPAVTFVDEVGVGAGVVDRLRQLGYEVVGVNGGTKADEPKRYYNKRAEMWGRMREWLAGASIDYDADARSSFIGVEYGYADNRAEGEQIRLERKEDMKKRGLSSPDEADALALTFAEHIPGGAGVNSVEPEDFVEPEEAYL